MIYDKQPDGFIPDGEAVGVFIENNGKILLLKRCLHKYYGGKWGVPGGKVYISDNNNLKKSAIREVFEETGLIFLPDDINYIKTFYVEFPDRKFIYHKYNVTTSNTQNIVLSKDEHTDFLWITPKEALNLELILHEDDCIKDFYGIK